MTNPRYFQCLITLIVLLTLCLIQPGIGDAKASKGFLLHEPLTRTTSTAIGGRIYIFGGENKTDMTDRIMFMDPDTGEIELAPVNLPFPVTNPTAVTDGESAYIIGGETGELVPEDVCAVNRSRDLVVFTPPDEIEHVIDFFPYELEGNAIAYDGNYFYLFGNCMCSSRDVRRNVIRFDPEEREYDIFERVVPFNISGSAAVWYGDAAYVFGGRTDGGKILDTVLRYVPGRPVETLNAHLPEPVFKTGIALDGDLAYILGGMAQDGPTDTIQLFDLDDGSFSKADRSLAEPRATRACVSLGDNIYLVGGDMSEGPSQSIELFTFPRTGPEEEKWSYDRDDVLLVAAIAGSVVLVVVVAVIYIRDYVKYRKQKDSEIETEEQSKKEDRHGS